jgi:hypothetical protein
MTHERDLVLGKPHACDIPLAGLVDYSAALDGWGN